MRRLAVGTGAFLLVLLTVSVAIALGSADLTLVEVIGVLLHRIGLGPAPDVATEQIVWNLRLPRVLLALVVGGGLSIVGVAMQALVRNPLAEPYILGVSAGASTGASLFYLGFLPPLLSRTLSMPLAAFCGALLAISLVYAVAYTRGGVQTTRLLLAGVAVSALFTAASAFVLYASPEPTKIQAVLFWTQGSFSGATWPRLPIPTAAALLGLFTLLVVWRPLDALMLGEEEAQNLGVPVEKLKRGLIVLAALVTGGLVAASGIIGFVGLIVPHAVRAVLGVPHLRVLPWSFLAGGIFMAWADVAARTLLPVELPIGVLTALCGVPFFLFLLRHRPYGFGS